MKTRTTSVHSLFAHLRKTNLRYHSHATHASFEALKICVDKFNKHSTGILLKSDMALCLSLKLKLDQSLVYYVCSLDRLKYRITQY